MKKCPACQNILKENEFNKCRKSGTGIKTKDSGDFRREAA